MSQFDISKLPKGPKGFMHDWGSDQRAFKGVPWGKAMMWIFLLSDTFIFSCFLISLMTARASTTVAWPYPSEVFGLTVFGTSVPLLLIAIMTFVLITSSGTMAIAVKYGYEKNRKLCGWFLLSTAIGGLTFAFITGQLLVWQHYVNLGQYASTNPGNAFFYLFTALHGLHVLGGLFFWGKATTKLFTKNFNILKIKQAIELCAIYWHFLLIVWFILFGLMIAT